MATTVSTIERGLWTKGDCSPLNSRSSSPVKTHINDITQTIESAPINNGIALANLSCESYESSSSDFLLHPSEVSPRVKHIPSLDNLFSTPSRINRQLELEPHGVAVENIQTPNHLRSRSSSALSMRSCSSRPSSFRSGANSRPGSFRCSSPTDIRSEVRSPSYFLQLKSKSRSFTLADAEQGLKCSSSASSATEVADEFEEGPVIEVEEVMRELNML